MEEKVRNLIEKEVNNMGISISDIIYEKEGNNYFLRMALMCDISDTKHILNFLFTTTMQ